MTTSNNKTPQERRDALMRGARFFDKSRDSIRRTRTIVDESRNRRFTPEESLAVGLDLIKRFYIFPARAGFKDPLIRGYDTLASRDPAKITKWAEKNPGCNWGISLVRNRIWPADVDTKEGKQGLETRAAIEREHGGWPLTFRVITPSGGFHDYYRGDHQFGLGVAGFGEGIDSPRYLVAPGCKLVDARYMRQEKDGREVEVKRQIGGVYEADFLVEEIVERPDFFPVLFAKAADRKAERKRKQREKIGVTGAVYSYDELAAIVELIDIHKFHSDHDTADEPDRWVRLILSMVDGSTCDEDVRDLALDLSMRDDRYAWDFDGIEKQIDHMASRTTDDVGVTVDTFNWFAANNAIDGKADEMAKLIKWTFATSAQDDFEGDDPEAETIETEQAAIVTELVEVMKQWVWVSTLDRFIDRTDSTIVLKKDAFNDKYRYLSPKGPLSNFLHSRREHTILKPDRVVYRPGEGEFLRGGRDWNLWRPSEIVAAEGDTSVWDKHLEYLLPDAGQRDRLLDWLAGVLQRLGVKPMHALLIIGREQGTGKSLVLRVLAKLIGDSNWKPLTQDILASGFTGWAMRTKLVTVEELRAVSKTEVAKKLHPWITQKEMVVNEKNLPTFTLDQVIAFAFMSNKPDAIEIDTSDRRYLVLETEAVPHVEGDAYYTRLYALLDDPVALGAILHVLMSRDLKGYNICGRAPETAAKGELKEATASDIVRWMTEHAGEAPYRYKVVRLAEVEAELPRSIHRSPHKLIEALKARGYTSFAEPIEPDKKRGDRFRVWLHPELEDRDRLSVSAIERLYNAERPSSDFD